MRKAHKIQHHLYNGREKDLGRSDDSHISVCSLVPSPEIRTPVSNCPVNISTWTLNRHLEFDMAKPVLLTPPTCSSHSLPILLDGSCILLMDQ